MAPSSEDAPLMGSTPLSPRRQYTAVSGDDAAHDSDTDSFHQGAVSPPSGARSQGVARMAAISSQLSLRERSALFFGIFLVGYAYGLDSQVRSTYQPYATSSYSLHSYTATINVLRSVVSVAAQPTAAKIADVFGRFEVVAVATVFYILGTAIEASAQSVEAYCVGAVTYQIGYSCIVLLMEVLIADISSMRARVFFSYVPAVPFLVNTWISGNITSAVLSRTTWRWGIGMWCIIYAIASVPLLVTLYSLGRRVDELADEEEGRGHKPLKLSSFSRVGTQVFHQLDVVGLITVIAAFSLILAPLTIAGGTVAHWRSPSIIVPLVIGFLCIPAFIIWEHRGARYPLVPFHLLTDRGVWAALAVRSLLNFAWYTQGNYLYTVLIVAFDFPVDTATRILSFFAFFGVVSGVVVGLVIYKIRRLKYVIVAGTCVFMLAFALLIQHPGGASQASKSGLMGAQILLGLAGGLFAYPTQASIQASATHEHVAVLTGLYLSFYNVGSAFGTSLSGAVWTQTLYPALEANLAFQPNTTLARAVYSSPFQVVPQYPVGTEIRGAIIDSYRHVQRLLCIAGIAICVPMIGFALALRNPKLSERQVQLEAEVDALRRSEL